MEITLTGDDLRTIADAVDHTVDALGAFSDEDGVIRDEYVNVRVEITLPNTDEVAGEVRWHGDGYWAYFPRGES